MKHIKYFGRLYWFAGLATILIWLFVDWELGLASLSTVIILTLLEATFSADNAVVNSKVLTTLSPLWQNLFMTIGILFAVFFVRFFLPILIVMFSASISFMNVIDLALHHPHEYAEVLHRAEPLINAFGGTFLLMISLSYFIDFQKQTHWFRFLERRLGSLGRFDNITTFIMLITSIVLYFTVEPAYHDVVFIASIAAMTTHIGLGLTNAIIGGKDASNQSKVSIHKTGWAAFAAFCYLEILDASFSLDGVIGAFAITTSVLLIMAGLGAGALWVRSMTVHLVKANALAKYVFLEHGAHWAIGFLGGVMLLKLYHVNPPEWVTGSLGLVFIASAIIWSKHYTRKLADQQSDTPM